jgi:hypothetical protein
MGLKVTNNAFGTLNAGINSSVTTVVLAAGQGALFPTLSAGDYFYATLIDTSNNLEIVKVTARSTDTMTIVRAQDNTTARAYSTNDRFELRPTAALFNEKANTDDVTTLLAAKQAASSTLTTYASTGVGMRNRVINGDMRIDQRNGGASVSIGAGNSQQFMTDRFYVQNLGSTAAYSAQQVTDAPPGFSHSLKITVTASTTPSGSESRLIGHHIEGLTTVDFASGTASAVAVTISFWTKSSLTGTFSACYLNGDSTRVYGFNFTISSANTWEYKTVTIAGDTTGTWPKTNTTGSRIQFNLGSTNDNLQATAGVWSGTGGSRGVQGSVSLCATNGATFQLTGLQLEKGSAATPFDFRLYTTELALCQRYYYQYTAATQFGQNGGNISNGYSTYFGFTVPFKVSMRTNPTIVQNMSLSTDSVGTVVYAANEENYTVNHGNMSGLYSYWSGTFKVSAEI